MENALEQTKPSDYRAGSAGGGASHTPGPWMVIPGAQPGIAPADGGEPIIHEGHSTSFCGVFGDSRGEMTANALLIAAAPALLAACRAAEAALQSCYEVVEFPADGKSDCDCALVALRAAMAQAMGEPANSELSGE